MRIVVTRTNIITTVGRRGKPEQKCINKAVVLHNRSAQAQDTKEIRLFDVVSCFAQYRGWCWERRERKMLNVIVQVSTK